MPVSLVKLTNSDMRTHGEFKWYLGQTVSVPRSRRGGMLCSDQVLHAYHNVEQALLLNGAHANFSSDKLVFTAITPEIVADDGTKVGVHELILTESVVIPEWWLDIEVRKDIQVQFAVLCARTVLDIYERHCPDNDKPRKAIEVAEHYLRDKSAASATDIAVRNAAVRNVACNASRASMSCNNHAGSIAAHAACSAACSVSYIYHDAASHAAVHAADASFYANRVINTAVLATQAVELRRNKY